MRSALLCLALVACNEHGMRPPPPDIGPPPPPPVGPVSLVIVHEGVPRENVTVVFQEPEGPVVATVSTDANGRATATMRAGGTVTAFDPFGAPAAGEPNQLRTFTGVQPFDELRLGIDVQTQAIGVRFTAPLLQGAASYELHTSCGGGALTATGAQEPTAQITLRGCGPLADVAVIARDASGAALRAVVDEDVPVAEGAAVVLSGPYQPLSDVTIEYSSIPDGYSGIASRAGVLSPPAFLATSATLPVEFGIARTTVAMPPMFGAVQRFEARPIPIDPKPGVQGVVHWTPFSTNQFFFLWDALLPAYLERPRFSPPRSIFWSEGAFARDSLDDAFVFESGPPPDDATPDVVIATVHVEREGMAYDWTIASRYVGPVVTLPPLPEAVGPFNPRATDAVEVTRLTTLDVPGGFEAIRSRALAFDDYDDLISGDFGRISFQELAPN